MLTKLSIASIALAGLAGAALAGEQPPAHAGHFNPFVPARRPAVMGPSLGMAMLSATVDSNGTIVRGAGTTGSTYVGVGSYEVDFDRDVSGCTYASNIGQTVSSGQSEGQSNVAPRSGNAEGVLVVTTDSAGNSTDLPFHLIVFCAK